MRVSYCSTFFIYGRNILNRKELIEEISNKTGVSKDSVKKMLTALTETVAVKLGEGQTVCITGFGTFYVSEQAEHISKDVNTGLRRKIPKVTVLRYRYAKHFKEKVNKTFNL